MLDLLQNPRIIDAANDPDLRARLKKLDVERGLNYATQKQRMKYIATIGLEVHVQLKTRSKMFCACPVEFGAPPNTHTCPVCLGLPGALPVMNHEALRMTVLTGLMLGLRHRADLQVRSQKLFLSGHAEELSDLAIRHAALR